MGFWALLLIVLGILVAVGMVSFFLEKRRTTALQAIASQLGLAFIPSDKDKELRAKYTAFRLFDRGHSRRLFNIMEGKTTEGFVRIFDYEYTIGKGGRNARVEQQTIIHIASEKLQASLFYMRPEGVLERMGTAFMGTQDIDFESNTAFSQAYQLQSAYEREVRIFFNEARLAYFASNTGWYIETRNREVIIYKEGYRCTTAGTPDFYQQALEVYKALVS
jgi:hypothetical protein